MAQSACNRYSICVTTPFLCQALTITSSYTSDLVKIKVTQGDLTATFTIHEAVLVAKSPYFAALRNFKEGKERAVDLDDLSPKTFDHIAEWLYSDSIPKYEKTLHDYLQMQEHGVR